MQMQPRQIPQPKTQPAEPIYGVGELYLFPRHTRATYREAFGEEAPPYDPAKRIKRWFDSTAMEVSRRDAADEAVTYRVHDPGDPTGLKLLMMTRGEAAAVNLPGSVVYPKYAPAPTQAWVNGPDGSAAFPVQYLCSREQAEEMAQELGEVGQLPAMQVPNGPYMVVWGQETRRPWTIQFKGQTIYAETLRRAKFAGGVGAPGWFDTSGAEPVWVPGPVETGEHDLRPEVLMPVRDLQWNEVLEKTLVGTWRVRRRDLMTDVADQDAERRRMLWLLEKIAEKLGVQV
jgi:hypothetical protein